MISNDGSKSGFSGGEGAKYTHLFYEELFKNNPEGILLVDQKGVIIKANNEFTKIFGYTEDELIGANVDDLLTNNHLVGDAYTLTKRAASGEKFTFETKRLKKDGTTIHVSILGAPIIVDGIQIGIIGIYRDISVSREMRRMIQYERDLFNTFIEHIPDSIFFKDTQNKFLRVNQATLDKFNLTRHEELIGKTDYDFFAREHADKAAEDEQEILESGKPIIAKEEHEVFTDGTEKWVSTTKIPFTDSNNKIVGTCGITRDITPMKLAELKQAEYNDELKKLNIAKDKFFSILAHDLRSPFTALLGYSEMLKCECNNMEPEEVESIASSVYESAKKLYQLLDNLLEHSRAQLGRIKFEPANVQLVKIATSIIGLLSPNAERKNIRLVNEIEESLDMEADEFMLNTIFRNLISNAIKFTEEGGEIIIRAKLLSEVVEISIADSGTGMSPEETSKIFDNEYGFTHPGTQNESGTGLGLLLCKEFIQKHNGNIWVESKKNIGSTFYFNLPLKQSDK